MSELVEEEEETEESDNEVVGFYSGYLRVSLRGDGQVSALGTPQRPSAEADAQPCRNHRVELGIELGHYERHVSRKG